uniref:Uncharacterized protein n=1 Tax=Hyaloperonospora arabidopsidis (strain Emoy2) TaxID=559515 RepID=M4B812_HYAAE
MLQRTAQLQRAWSNGVSFLDSLEATTCLGRHERRHLGYTRSAFKESSTLQRT